MIRENILQFCLFFLLFAPCLSQTLCDDSFVGPFDELLVNGNATIGGCVFSGTAQKITVINGGRLWVLGHANVKQIHATDAESITLSLGATVMNVLSIRTKEEVFVGSGSRVGTLFMKDSGPLENSGFIGILTSKNSGNLNITGGVIGNPQSNGLFIQNGQPEVSLCGASIAGIHTTDSSPRFIAENSSNCPPSNISSLYSVGPGTVTVEGVRLTGKHSFNAYGVEEVKINSTTILGQVGTRLISGALSLIDVLVDGVVSLSGSQSSTRIEGSKFKGAVRIGAPDWNARRASKSSLSTSVSTSTFEQSVALGPSSGKVDISESKFSKQNVYLETRSGGVTFTGNEDVGLLRVQGNGSGVEVTDNKISHGDFRSNVRGVELAENTFETLTCFRNNPVPELVNNTVSKGGTGQCVSA